MLRGHQDLRVYQLAYRLAMEIYDATKTFPREEKYSLTDQIRRSSRSVAANIGEAFRKRRYHGMFVNKLTDSDAEATETQIWLHFACDCGYLSQDKHRELEQGYLEIGRVLGQMLSDPSKFQIH